MKQGAKGRVNFLSYIDRSIQLLCKENLTKVTVLTCFCGFYMLFHVNFVGLKCPVPGDWHALHSLVFFKQVLITATFYNIIIVKIYKLV